MFVNLFRVIADLDCLRYSTMLSSSRSAEVAIIGSCLQTLSYILSISQRIGCHNASGRLWMPPDEIGADVRPGLVGGVEPGHDHPDRRTDACPRYAESSLDAPRDLDTRLAGSSR